ncbi:MAG TPA: LuxR C-terminal-related transcriptional regulator [Phenylobacterium sp.]|nr:LuxR C-terminal-related transcriptional regulator [Phenylobacterium sp.]
MVSADGRAMSALSAGLMPMRRGAEGTPIARLLGVTSRDTAGRLEQAVAKAVREGEAGLVMARTGDSQIGMLVSVRPAREPGYAVVGVTDLDEPPAMPGWAELAELFGISRAEAEIALGLHEGIDLAEIAQQRGVRLDTVRNQVKSLLRKLGLTSQKHLAATLVRVALAAPGRAASTPGGELRIAS